MGILFEISYRVSDWTQICRLQACYGRSSNSTSGKVPGTASPLSFSMTLTWIRDSEDVMYLALEKCFAGFPTYQNRAQGRLKYR